MKAAALLGAMLLVLPALSGCIGGTANDWAYKMVGLRSVGDLTGRGIRVAIVDTGIDAHHKSLDHASIIWKDEINGKADPYDDVGHGSHVAGIIMGKGASFNGRISGFELRGGAPDVDLIVVKAIRAEDGKGPSAAVADGISFAVQNQADVICLSLGSNPGALNLLPSDIQQSVNNAVNQGVMVVASAGNVQEGQSQNDVATPASIDLVVAVGAVDEAKKVADFSLHGSQSANEGPLGNGVGGRSDPNKKPELVAPGVKIKSAWKDGGYAIASGTSQAAPFVCGALALLLQKCPALRARNSSDLVRTVKNALMRTAEPLPGQATPHDDAAGYGLLRADRLVAAFGENC